MARPNIILVAEDSEGDCFILSRACQKAGLPYRLQFVENGVQAIEYLKGEGPFSNRDRFPLPDLLLLDLKMPRLDGFDVLKWLRNSPALSHLPAIVLSDSDLDFDKRRARNLGANGFYTKTANEAKLKAMFLEIAERHLKTPLSHPAMVLGAGRPENHAAKLHH
jgi:CheY-like chemotaxis protein